MKEISVPSPTIKDRLFNNDIRKADLEKKGFARIPNSLMEKDSQQVQKLVGQRGYAMVTGLFRDIEKLIEPRSKWEKRTYVFDPRVIEVVIIARNDEEVEDENHDFLKAYEQGFPLLYTENERGKETILLRPIEAELRSA